MDADLSYTMHPGAQGTDCQPMTPAANLSLCSSLLHLHCHLGLLQRLSEKQSEFWISKSFPYSSSLPSCYQDPHHSYTSDGLNGFTGSFSRTTGQGIEGQAWVKEPGRRLLGRKARGTLDLTTDGTGWLKGTVTTIHSHSREEGLSDSCTALAVNAAATQPALFTSHLCPKHITKIWAWWCTPTVPVTGGRDKLLSV